MYVCIQHMYIHIFICMYVCMYIYICMCVFVCVRACVRVRCFPRQRITAYLLHLGLTLIRGGGSLHVESGLKVKGALQLLMNRCG